MRDDLYRLLKSPCKYSPMKYGGDFPYLSNHEEYTMLIQVHLRKNGMAYNDYGNVASQYVKNCRKSIKLLRNVIISMITEKGFNWFW